MSLYPPGRPKRYDPIAGKGTLPPHAPGEYRIRDGKTNAILYIGETCDLRRRMQEHLRIGKIRQFIGRSRRRTCGLNTKKPAPLPTPAPAAPTSKKRSGSTRPPSTAPAAAKDASPANSIVVFRDPLRGYKALCFPKPRPVSGALYFYPKKKARSASAGLSHGFFTS